MPAAMDAEAPILVRREGPVALLTLNRPAKSNALEPPLVEMLRAELRRVASGEAVRVVVLTGSGRAFCAGLDLKHLVTLAGSERRAYLETVLGLFQDVWRLPQPVIAAINGACVAGGFDLSSFCDLRFASDSAIFSQTEILLGLNAISTPLFHTIGLGAARELAYLGHRIPAADAHRIGLVNRVFQNEELLRRSMELAAEVASRPRSALLLTKRLTREMLDKKVDDALEAAGAGILGAMESPTQARILQEYVSRLSAPRG